MATTNNPPFATADGKPIDPATNSTKPTNFLETNGRSANADPTPPRLPSTYSPTQSVDLTVEPTRAPTAPGFVSRPQRAPQPEDSDADHAEIPQGGRGMRDAASVRNAGTGSV